MYKLLPHLTVSLVSLQSQHADYNLGRPPQGGPRGATVDSNAPWTPPPPNASLHTSEPITTHAASVSSTATTTRSFPSTRRLAKSIHGRRRNLLCQSQESHNELVPPLTPPTPSLSLVRPGHVQRPSNASVHWLPTAQLTCTAPSTVRHSVSTEHGRRGKRTSPRPGHSLQ